MFGNVFGLEKYKEVNNKYQSFTTSDNNKLQVLQNTLKRMLTGAVYNTTTSDLLKQTDSLSVQQMIAFQTMVMTYKIVRSRKPTYLAEKMKFRERGKSGSVQQPNHSISITKEGFVYRGITLMNMLDVPLRCEPKLEKFKAGLRDWVKKNISAKPKFQAVCRAVRQPTQAQLGTSTEHSRNLITHYFQPQ